MKQGMVDEYRVSTYIKGGSGREDILTVPVRLAWQPGGVMTESGQPEWVARITQRNEVLAKAEWEKSAQESSAGDVIVSMVIMPLLFGLPLLAIVLCVIAFVRWKGGWRYAGRRRAPGRSSPNEFRKAPRGKREHHED